MLSRDKRIDKHLFREVFSRGSSIPGTYLYAKILPIKEDKNRFAFAVPKSVASTAAERNELKRRGYSCLIPLIQDVQTGIAVVFFFKKEAVSAKREEVCRDINGIIKKIKV